MASYQIPQFLDSGDKILGPLNMRQFGYALGGFFVAVFIFTVFNAIIPGLGNYAIIPCIPIVGVALYIALGRYNGRDSEIYVYKFIIYNIKPKIMVYTRVPDNTDLDAKLSQLTFAVINKRWSENNTQQKKNDTNKFYDFNNQQSNEKAKKIRELGYNLDSSLYNTLNKVQGEELLIRNKEEILSRLNPKQNRNNSNSVNSSLLNNQRPSQTFPETESVSVNDNFFTYEN